MHKMYKLPLILIAVFIIFFLMIKIPNTWEYHAEVIPPEVTNRHETVDIIISTNVSTTTLVSTTTTSTTTPITVQEKTNIFPTVVPFTPVIKVPRIKPQILVTKRGITLEECTLRINNSPFYYDSSMQSVKKTKELSDAGNIADAELLREISCTPQAIWLSGQDNVYTKEKIRKVIDESIIQNKIPVFVLYNGPSSGTLEWRNIERGVEYEKWMRLVADTIKDDKVWIILEPDALSLSYNLSESDRTSRLAELNGAVSTLVTYAPNARVYIDAGHSNWKSEKIAAEYLLRAGVKYAYGFSLNVSNYQTTESQVVYGKKLSALISNKHFIIDTSRNGNGPPINNEWCNPSGRAIGKVPTIVTNETLADGFLWVKLPGESDGYCNGGNSAGKFWFEYALDLVKNQK